MTLFFVRKFMTPMQLIKTSPLAPAEILSFPSRATMPVVLVVEDDEDGRFLLKTMLEMSKFKVLETADGFEAIEIARRELPCLILMDVQLPTLDGIEAARRIRAFAPLRDTPIIAVSAHGGLNYRTAAVDAGCNDYIVKPYSLEELTTLLNRFISVDSKASAAQQRAMYV